MKLKYCFILLLLVYFLCGSVYAEDSNNLTSDALQEHTQVVLDENSDSMLDDDNVIYFDVNAEKEGNGSSDRPYKDINYIHYVLEGSTVQLASGVYDFNISRKFDNLVIVGESSQNTIVKNLVLGSGRLFPDEGDGVGSSLMIRNVTFFDSSFMYYNNFKAEDCVFHGYSKFNLINSEFKQTSSITLNNCGFIDNVCGNDYVISIDGGALDIQNSYVESIRNTLIYAVNSDVLWNNVNAKKSTLKNSDNLISMENCFLHVSNSDFEENNVSGGSLIRIYEGHLIVCNSTFTDNNIDTGAVNSNYVFVNITDSSFKNNNAKRFAGAVFTAQSTLLLNNITFEKNTALWSGGAVIALNTNLQIKTCNFTENSAAYSGGALYAMYGKILVTESVFNSNHGLNGSAIFFDYINPYENLTLYHNNFTGNDKYSIYTLADEDYDFKDNNIDADDIFQTRYFNIVIGDGDYSSITFTPSFNGTIPEYYDLRQLGYVTPVRNQGPDGNCWAFTAIATLESCILKASGTIYDLSEVNMKNLMAWFSDYGRSKLPNIGGNTEMAIAYLASWLGPVYENDDPYSPLNSLSEVLHSIVHVQNALYLNYSNPDSIKKAIIEYGGVGVGMRWDDKYINGSTYYCWENYPSSNHAVTIVGWNDSYSRYNFNNTSLPEKDGAWIIKNSWGNNSGEEGYFYVSYSDKVFGLYGTPYTFIFNDTIRFDKNYQYDISGQASYSFYTDYKTSWYKNVFNATDREDLLAVSTYFLEENTEYTVSIIVNNQLAINQSGVSNRGYYTINLNRSVPLNRGDIFEVQFKITSPANQARVPIADNSNSYKNLAKPGISFMSSDGFNWEDLYNMKNVACIKAFTALYKINTTISLKVNDSVITANVTDQFGDILNGTVEFKINNEIRNINITNGNAVLPYDFTYYDIYYITASWNREGYRTSIANTIYETQWDVDFNVDDIAYSEDLIINIISGKGKLLNNLTIQIGDYHYSVNPSDLIFKVPDTLNAKLWNVSVSYVTENGYEKVMNKSFTINKTLSGLTAAESISYDYDSEDSFNIDYTGASNVDIRVIDHSEAVITVENKVIRISNLKVGEYKVNITTVPDENHNAVSKIVNLTVNKADSTLNVSDIAFDYGNIGYLNVEFSGASKVIVSVINHDEAVIDNRGNVIQISNLSIGEYKLNVKTVADENHNAVEKNVTLTVNKINEKVDIKIPQLTSGKSNTVPVMLSADAKGNITLTIDNRIISVTPLSDGSALIEIPKLASGSHSISISYSGDEYHAAFTQTQSVNVASLSKITSGNVNAYYLDGTVYKVCVFADDGTPLAGAKVTFKVNGKNVAVITTDKEGYASYKITQTPKTYSITAEANGLKATNKLNVKQVINVKKVSKVKKSKITKVKITLKGKTVYKNKKLTVKFNGKKYTVKTNKKGVAIFKVTKKMLKKFKVGKKVKYTVIYSADKLTRYVKVVK